MKLSVIMSSLVMGVCFQSSVYAVPMPPVPTEPVYFEPPVITATDDIRQQSCAELDNAIRYLHPYRYTYKPEFSQDPYNVIAVSATATNYSLNGLLSAAFLGYSAAIDDKERRRMVEVEQQIAMFQQVKAEKHCFER